MLKEKFLCLFVISAFFTSTLMVESKIPSEVMQVLNDKDKTDKAKSRIQVAKAVKDHLKSVKESAFSIGDAEQKNSVIAVVEYLCPHCHDFLKDLKGIDFKKNKINLSVLALPVFGTPTSKQFDAILQYAYKAKPSEYVNVLANYKRNDKDGLVKLIRETYTIDLPDTIINDMNAISNQEKLLVDLGIPFVPMLFFVRAIDQLVIPLVNVPAAKFVDLVKKLENLDEEDIKRLKEILGQ